MQENVIVTPVSLPKLSIEIVVVVLGLRPVNVDQVSTEETGQYHYACEWG